MDGRERQLVVGGSRRLRRPSGAAARFVRMPSWGAVKVASVIATGNGARGVVGGSKRFMRDRVRLHV